MQADYISLYKINLDTNQYPVKQKLYKSCQAAYKYFRLNYTSSAIPAQEEYKPGGTMSITTGSNAGRFLDGGSDSMGRWTYQTLSCKVYRNLTIITAYQVCDQQIIEEERIRTMTATAQQVSMLRQQNREEQPRSAFIKDLRGFIRTEKAKGHGILLLGDFNEPLDVTYDGMTKLCSDFNLTDLMFQLIGDDDFPTWFRGKDRRDDYVLCDLWVAEAIEDGCYEPFQFRTKGDHRNIILDFNSDKLFGNPTYNLHNQAQREFSSKEGASNRIFIQNKTQYLLQHKFNERLEKLRAQWDPELAEGLDNDYQRSSTSAAKKCKKKPNVAFVRKLANLRKQKNVLLRLISQHNTGHSLSNSIAHLVKDGHDFTIPETHEECKKLCRALQREIKTLAKNALSHRRNEQKELQREATQQGDKKKATEIRNKIVAENTKAMFKKLRGIRGNAKT